MAKKKYVPQGTYLACDKGTVPMEFMITNNNNSFLFEEPVANTGDMVPMVNVMPLGVCTITKNACVPAPIMWDGFEDGIFVGFFNPLLEDSVLPCSVGGKIEIYYSLEDATAACAEEGGGFWSTLGKVVLVVAAVALIVVTGGMAIAAIGAVAAASGALATGIAVTVAALEVAGCLLTVKALYDYSQDGDEEALFKEVALGFLFLGAGKALEKGFRAWRGARAAKLARQNEINEQVLKAMDPNGAGDNILRAGDSVAQVIDDVPYDQIGRTQPCFLAGTLVKTPNGDIEIEKLAPGDTVFSYDLENERIEEKAILRLYDNWTNRYFGIETESNTLINATSKHLFWITDIKKWVPAKELTIGMPILNSSGKVETITRISPSPEVDLPTYNLEIKDFHNYFVGQLGVLVHNQNKPSLFESTTKNNVDFYQVRNNQTGKLEYIGQTQQGIDVRKGQHIAEGAKKGNFKADWGDPAKYTFEPVDIPKSGPLTPYEAHVWEKHLIEEAKLNNNPLNNTANPIGEAKYNAFKDLHNPC